MPSRMIRRLAHLSGARALNIHQADSRSQALLLSHPSPLLRDTQRNTALRQLAKTKMPGLKKLTELELGLKIQSGAHSSVCAKKTN